MAQKGLHLCYETIWDFVRLLQFPRPSFPGMRMTSSYYAFYCKCHRWSFANNLKITIKEVVRGKRVNLLYIGS